MLFVRLRTRYFPNKRLSINNAFKRPPPSKSNFSPVALRGLGKARALVGS
jgi:hypothetical protein